jgi:glycosyltransferase involved in cell wall biosynthesis
MKKILITSATYWTSPIHIGSHHISKAFAKRGWQTAFLSDPISPFHIFSSGDDLSERIRIYKSNGDNDGNIWNYVPATFFPPINKPFFKSDWVLKNWGSFTVPDIARILKNQDKDNVDILFFENPTYGFLQNQINHKFSILRIADFNKAFDNYSQAKIIAEEKLARNVDLVVYTAKNLEEYVKSLRPKDMYYFPNGVDYWHFQDFHAETPKDLQGIKSPIVMYVGALNYWFDFELINHVANQMPEASFVLIGPGESAVERLSHKENLHYLGPKDFNQIPEYINHADIGIIPFNVNKYADLVHKINPLKLYEYLSCGLPVVSTAWREIEQINSPAILTRNTEEFIEGVKIAIELSKRNDLKTSYREFSKTRSWDNFVETLLGYIGF